MKDLANELKGRSCLVFLDLEGTQFSHELIELGAVIGILNEEGRIKKTLKPFRVYVKAIRPVGKVVKDLTGITDQFLAKNGISFADAMSQFRDYVGKYWDKCSFVTFGNHDLVIFNDSARMNPSFKAPYVRHIRNRYFDYSAWLFKYAQSEQGNPLSLEHYLELFEVQFSGKEHDAADDAYNLLRLYDTVLDRKDILEREYKKTLARAKKLPKPIKDAIDKLNAGESVTPEDWDNLIKESIR